MKAVILAAGEGKRLRPFTENIPKVMLPVANKPIISYVVDALVSNGITDIIIVVGYKKESIMQYFKSYHKANLLFVTQEKQLGTAHALLQAESFIDDSFFVLPGDNIISAPLISKLLIHQSEYGIVIKKFEKPSKYGVVSIEKNILKNIVEKPFNIEQNSFISTGIYKFPKSIFQDIKEITNKGEYKLTSMIQALLRNEIKIPALQANEWRDVVYPWDLLTVNDAQLRKTISQTNGIIEKNVTIKGPVFIGANTLIHSGSYLIGPVVIGENCEIGPNTTIFPSTTIGNNVLIRSFVEIRNSVLMDNVTIESNAFVTHSVLGRGSRTGHGFSTILGDAQKQGHNVLIDIPNIGAMVAEDSIIKNHVVTYPGVIIGRHCIISPLKQIHEDIESETKVM